MEVEIPNSRVKTEPLEWGPTVKTEYQEESESSSENNQPRYEKSYLIRVILYIISFLCIKIFKILKHHDEKAIFRF